MPYSPYKCYVKYRVKSKLDRTQLYITYRSILTTCAIALRLLLVHGLRVGHQADTRMTWDCTSAAINMCDSPGPSPLSLTAARPAAANAD